MFKFLTLFNKYNEFFIFFKLMVFPGSFYSIIIYYYAHGKYICNQVLFLSYILFAWCQEPNPWSCNLLVNWSDTDIPSQPWAYFISQAGLEPALHLSLPLIYWDYQYLSSPNPVFYFWLFHIYCPVYRLEKEYIWNINNVNAEDQVHNYSLMS